MRNKKFYIPFIILVLVWIASTVKQVTTALSGNQNETLAWSCFTFGILAVMVLMYTRYREQS